MRCGGRYADGTAQVAADMRQVLLTVDVEALPSRAERDHVARLVFGRFAGHPSMGLREMMAEAEKRSMRLTCFVDYCEYDLYGNAFLDVAREIAARGHDVQLHAHPEVMKPETWARLGLAKPAGSLDGFSESEADRLFDWLLGLHGSVCSAAPVAFRGGGYRCSNNILAAMRRHGLAVSSNHNPGRQNQLDDRESCEVFRHANGVLEVPISVLHRDGARFEFNFNQYGFADSVDWFADAFWNRYGDRSILNLVMHSRSFLAMDARKRFYVPKDVQPTALFRSVLDRFQAWQAEVIGIAQWAEARDTAVRRKARAKGTQMSRRPCGNLPSTVTTPQEVQSVAQVHEVDRHLRPEAGGRSRRASAARPACPVCGDARRLVRRLQRAPAGALRVLRGARTPALVGTGLECEPQARRAHRRSNTRCWCRPPNPSGMIFAAGLPFIARRSISGPKRAATSLPTCARCRRCRMRASISSSPRTYCRTCTTWMRRCPR